MIDFARVFPWWPDRNRPGDWTVRPPDGELELRNAIDAAWQLSRHYRNGYAQKTTLAERRRWALDAALMLDMMATELHNRLPKESGQQQMNRVTPVTIRRRAIEDEPPQA